MKIWNVAKGKATIEEKEKSPLELMVDKLKLKSDAGRINDKVIEDFIYEMYFRIKQSFPVSAEQATKIEELFEHN